MKLKEAMKIIDNGWIRKPKGFRVRFQRRGNEEIMTEYIPGPDEKPMESDVVAWRVAWKLAETQRENREGLENEEMFNIFVVDDLGSPVNYYGTGKPEVFIPQKD